MYQAHHSANHPHGFYVIDITTGDIVQYRLQSAIESTLGLDDLAVKSESRLDDSFQTGVLDASFQPTIHSHSGS